MPESRSQALSSEFILLARSSVVISSPTVFLLERVCDPESFMKIKYRELEDDGYIPRTTFHRRSCPGGGGGRKGWHSPRIGRTKPGGHILKFSMTERASSYFIVSRFHRKFRAPLRLGRGPTAISHRVESRSRFSARCSSVCPFGERSFSPVYFSPVLWLSDLNASLFRDAAKKFLSHAIEYAALN